MRPTLDDRHAVLFVLAVAAQAILTRQFCLAADQDPQRPTLVTTVNVPVVPGEIFAELRPYMSVRSAAFAGWAPDGKGILIKTTFGNSSQLHRVYQPGGRREQVTFFAEPASGRFIPYSDDGNLLMSMNRGGDENQQIYLFEAARYRTTRLTDGLSRNTLGPLSADGSKLVVRSNRGLESDEDVFVAEVYRPDSLQLVHRSDGQYWYGSHWSSDGTELLMRRYVSVTESQPAVLEFAAKRLHSLPTASDAPCVHSNLRLSPDGRYVYMATDARGEFCELARLDRQHSTYQWLSEGIAGEVMRVELNRHAGRVAFVVNDHGASRLYLLEPGAAADSPRPSPRELTLPPHMRLSDLKFHPDGTRLGFTLHSATAPSDAYSLDIEQARLVRWTYGTVGGLDPNVFVRPRRIQYESFDGRTIEALYYRPRTVSPDQPVPVILCLHGGPESRFHAAFDTRIQSYINVLACAVICPDVRGSTGYGKTFTGLDNGTRRNDSVRDVGALLDWIAGQSELDDGRVAVTGRSYGGYLVLASLVHYGSSFRAAIDTAGVVNFATFLDNTEPYRRDRRRVEYGDERDPQMREFFGKISPATRAAEIVTPLLVVHGVNDPRVPIDEAQNIVGRLRDLERTVWAVYVGDEGHSLSKRTNRDYVRAAEVCFLKQYLLP